VKQEIIFLRLSPLFRHLNLCFLFDFSFSYSRRFVIFFFLILLFLLYAVSCFILASSRQDSFIK